MGPSLLADDDLTGSGVDTGKPHLDHYDTQTAGKLFQGWIMTLKLFNANGFMPIQTFAVSRLRFIDSSCSGASAILGSRGKGLINCVEFLRKQRL